MFLIRDIDFYGIIIIVKRKFPIQSNHCSIVQIINSSKKGVFHVFYLLFITPALPMH